MSSIAQVKDGQFVESASQSSLGKAKGADGSGMDKDAFLQLLVAQMKYQDPLEPTSNTEYVSQYAQFSQVEQMQNMAGSMTLQRASSLVGQEVLIETTGSSGTEFSVQGRVDYVNYENNKAYLSIDGALYSMDDVKNVVDQTYLRASEWGTAFSEKVGMLPKLEDLSMENAEVIEALVREYESMSEYERSFVTNEATARMKYSVERLFEIREMQSAQEAVTPIDV